MIDEFRIWELKHQLKVDANQYAYLYDLKENKNTFKITS